jgi:hypothetical protein
MQEDAVKTCLWQIIKLGVLKVRHMLLLLLLMAP